MAIGAIYNTLEFGGVNSGTYGIYITGEAVFDAPKRAVNMVSVPGRNGAVAVDQGYWENITVAYPAGTFADSETNFAKAVSDFRNALASQVGYQRLTDSYHPSEYRMAMFVDGLGVEPVHYNEAGQFTLTFNCKPQRWLTSGESSTAVTSGDALTNPTLYDANPLLVADGYGTINIGSQSIEIESVELGDISLNSGESYSIKQTTSLVTPTLTVTLSGTSNLMTGDTITLGAVTYTENVTNNYYSFDSFSVSNESGTGSTQGSFSGKVLNITMSVPATALTYGTSSSATYSATVLYYYDGGSYVSDPKYVTIAYDGAQTVTITSDGDASGGIMTIVDSLNVSETTAYSTKVINDTVYIDLDVGEAYWIQNNEAVDANSAVALGSDLPVLEPGANTITYDNTITSLSIQSRWWQL